MKVLLVKWAEKVSGRSIDPGFVHKITGIYPPLGLLYIASALIKAGHDTSLIDLPAMRTRNFDLEQYLRKHKFTIVGFTTSTLLWPHTVKGIKYVRHVLPEAVIVLGGPHTCIFFEECMTVQELDIAVIGEGEETMVELVRAIEENKGLEIVKGIAYRKNSSVHYTGKRDLSNINEIAFPARYLLKGNHYSSIMAGSPFTTMITSRGCPFKCHFCTQIYWQNKFRLRSAENVMMEIEELVKDYRIKEIMMYDETFLINKQRVMSIARDIIKNKLKFKWDIRTRIDTLNEEVLSAIREAGCYKVHVGIESGSDRILEKMNKNIDTQTIIKKIGLLKKYGFEILGYFMIGYSSETYDEIMQTIDLSLRLPIDWAHYNITMPVPAVPLFDDAVKKGLLKRDYWHEWTRSFGENCPGPPYFNDSGLSSLQLESLLKKAYKRFYLRPSKFLGCSLKMMNRDRIKNGIIGLYNLIRQGD